MAATKTYTASLGAVAALNRCKPRTSWPRCWTRWPANSRVPPSPDVRRRRWSRGFAVVGRGVAYGTAFEAALKLSELTGMVAAPWSSPRTSCTGRSRSSSPASRSSPSRPPARPPQGMRELLEAAPARAARTLTVISDDDPGCRPIA